MEGDLGDRVLLDRIFSEQRIDCVMHFAAYSLVGESVEDPLAYYDNNTGKTAQLLTAMKGHGVLRFILSSTAAVYGEPEQIPISENASLDPTNSYGKSKGYRTVILYRAGERAIFVYGFSKSRRENIREGEKEQFKKMANQRTEGRELKAEDRRWRSEVGCGANDYP